MPQRCGPTSGAASQVPPILACFFVGVPTLDRDSALHPLFQAVVTIQYALIATLGFAGRGTSCTWGWVDNHINFAEHADTEGLYGFAAHRPL